MILPSAAGRLMEKELVALSKVFNLEESPKVFVLGGGILKTLMFLQRKSFLGSILILLLKENLKNYLIPAESEPI